MTDARSQNCYDLPLRFAGAVCVGALVMSAACSENATRTPVAPTSTSGPIPSSPTYTVSGVVRTTSDAPVAGARVVLLGQEPAVTALTGADGVYSISGVKGTIHNMSPLLSAASSGYFTDVEFANRTYGALTKDAQLDFRLVPSAPIAVGQVIDGQSPLGEPVCSHWGYGASACQRFALTAPASGTLELTFASSDPKFDIDIIGPDGTFALYDGFWLTQRHLTIPVDGGSAYEIRIIGGWNPPHEFQLSTALR